MTQAEKDTLIANNIETTNITIINLGNAKQVTRDNELIGYIMEDGTFKGSFKAK